jgi:hypothetical protein
MHSFKNAIELYEAMKVINVSNSHRIYYTVDVLRKNTAVMLNCNSLFSDLLYLKSDR